MAIREFVDYVGAFVRASSIGQLLEPSDIVGNIRFTHPTLYVFPGGEGDAALFGINGFNMLVDGGFSRKACFWNFVRHLDRLDGVLLTRVNNGNMGGMSGIVQRKVCSQVYPQIGHFFSNILVSKININQLGDLKSLFESWGRERERKKENSYYIDSGNYADRFEIKIGK